MRVLMGRPFLLTSTISPVFENKNETWIGTFSFQIIE
jgi:hypothetical protein